MTLWIIWTILPIQEEENTLFVCLLFQSNSEVPSHVKFEAHETRGKKAQYGTSQLRTNYLEKITDCRKRYTTNGVHSGAF